jgi:hypothetical protein
MVRADGPLRSFTRQFTVTDAKLPLQQILQCRLRAGNRNSWTACYFPVTLASNQVFKVGNMWDVRSARSNHIAK